VLEDWGRVIDAIDMPITVHDRSHVIRLANRRFLEASGRTLDQVIGEKCHRIAHCSEEPLADCPHNELLRSGRPVEKEFTSPDETRVTGITCYPLMDEGGTTVGSVHIVRDVTEVARLRERMERRSQTLARHMETLRRHLAEFNRAPGSNAIPFANDDVARCYDIRDCREEECPARASGGLRCWRLPSTRCERDGLVDAVDRLAFCQTCEVYRRATPDDLTALTEMMNDLVHLLRRKQLDLVHAERLAVLGELSATLAHELRSPLNSLSISTQRLGRRLASEPPEQGELERIQKGLTEDVRRLDDVVERFVRSVGRPGPAAAVALSTVVDDATSQIRPQAERLGVSLDVCRRPPDLELDGETSSHLRIILLNTLLNSVEASRRGDHIAVTCSQDGGHLGIEVADTGEGIRPDVLPRIQDPFFSTKPGGTGLGLTIVSWLVQREGGEIEVSSVQDNGTTVSVRLPCREPASPALEGGARA